MTNPTDSAQLKIAFFHSVDKTMVLSTMDSYESMVKSGHTVQISEIIGENLPYLSTSVAVDNWINLNPGILAKHEMISLTEIPNTNGQSWNIKVNGNWQRPIILNSTVSSPENNIPSMGYIFELYTGDNVRIGEGSGKWLVNPYQGIINFEAGYTPADKGWGIPKVRCYTYVGKKLSDVISDIKQSIQKITISETEPFGGNAHDIWIMMTETPEEG